MEGYLTKEDIDNKINSGKYRIHKKCNLLINEDGTEVIYLNDNRVLKIRETDRKRKRVTIPHVFNFSVSLLVYEAWYDDYITKGYDVHHKNLNKKNNHYTNLEKLDREAHESLHFLLDRQIDKNVELTREINERNSKEQLYQSLADKLKNIDILF